MEREKPTFDILGRIEPVSYTHLSSLLIQLIFLRSAKNLEIT